MGEIFIEPLVSVQLQVNPRSLSLLYALKIIMSTLQSAPPAGIHRNRYQTRQATL